MGIFLMVIALVAMASLIIVSVQQNMPQPGIKETDLKQFTSEEEFQAFVNESESEGYGYNRMFGGGEIAMALESADMATGGDSAPQAKTTADDYSTTNIQVEGVDEADIVKNDGKYIYVATGSKVVILDAYPADEMEILAEINFSASVNEIFINEDKLVVFGSGIVDSPRDDEDSDDDTVESKPIDSEDIVGEMMIAPGYPNRNYDPAILTYDISDRENPILENTVILEGNYVDSRMIGDYVYVVSNKYIYADVEPPVYYIDGVARSVVAEDIFYPTFRDNSYQFTSISSINLESGNFDTETYLLGTSYTMYVSENNIYLTQYKSASYDDYMDIMIEEVYLEILPDEYDTRMEEILGMDEYYNKEKAIGDLMDEWAESMEGQEMSKFEEIAEQLMENAMDEIAKLEGTAIYKIELDKMDIDYVASGMVPGTLLDQFSMDEYKGNLRVATTTGGGWMFGSRSESSNGMYVLNKNLDIVGSVDDLAQGERVYSSRFMGKRAYMVTFRQVDPLFVIDLSDPKNPEVLGELKITGVSEYLHPYDENHIIGIGKEATEEGRFLGMKVSLFDVSDVSNPIEVAGIEIGDRGTSSDALYDHKAVLFDKEKNLLVLPVDLYEINESSSRTYGQFVWQGAMVLDISPEGISERGRITHRAYDADDDGYYYKQYQSSIKRSLYMDDVLYTISQTKVKANFLDSLDEIKKVEISEGLDNNYYYGGFEEGMVF